MVDAPLMTLATLHRGAISLVTVATSSWPVTTRPWRWSKQGGVWMTHLDELFNGEL